MRLILTLFLLLLLNNCSLNKDSKYWTEDVVKKNENQKKLTNILKKSEDITTMTFEEYEIYIDDYTKKSKYPDINQ
ncbi:hypothetical protein OAP44_02490 [Candidatus Pelagibacter sp.]|jgi:hypothetical protein|nr:hypothetical protein [Candidatus Pelagibacter bacterium]MDA9793727.1 hypothetical protein [Candidatus Pelagibacter sp.]MDB3959894.1 hypothetical protein [Candidatus Pelagibacter sp.]MDC0442373.1 hypothetical protein [Candidatus Pelagibacter sp.]MDC0518913.1 hypothetical protein [Candidatus Pelagibacter sp.]|tara:strand:+ start:492 stop:719 length:228 start_codon:yes stop_codon:yes gene_type:complete